MIIRYYQEYDQLDYTDYFSSDFINYLASLNEISDPFMRNILLSDYYVSMSDFSKSSYFLEQAMQYASLKENKLDYFISSVYHKINKGAIAEAAKDFEANEDIIDKELVLERKLLLLYLKARVLYSLGKYAKALYVMQLINTIQTEDINSFYPSYFTQLEVEILLVNGKLEAAKTVLSRGDSYIERLNVPGNSFLFLNQLYFHAMLSRYSFDFNSELEKLQALLPLVVKVQGEESAMAAMIYYEMAAACSYTNNFEDLKRYNDLSRDIRAKLYNFPVVELAENHYLDALYYNYLSNHLESIRMIEKAASVLDEVNVVSHPLHNVLTFSKVLSYIEIGEDFKQMKSLLSQELKVLQSIRGEENPELIYYYLIYSEMCVAEENEEEANHFLQLALDVCKKALGDKHIVYADCLKGMAGLDRIRDYFEQAESKYIDALHIIKTNGYGNSLRYSNVLEFLGEMYIESGDCDKAISIYQECLKIERSLLPKYHLNFVLHYTALCESGMHIGDKDVVREYVVHLRDLLDNFKSKDNPYFAKAYQICSLSYELIGDLEEALKLMEKALLFLARLIARNANMGFSPLSLQIDYLRILAKMGEFDEAISYTEMILSKDMEFGEKIELSLRLADLYYVCEQYDNSIRLLQDTLTHEEIVDYRKDMFYILLSKNYLIQGKDQECKKYLDLALEERIHFFGEDNQETSDIIQSLVDWANKFGHEEEKKKYLNQLNKVRSKFLN